jgi:hypothetical protein
VTTLRVAHLYPEYLNIYADRGNIAVLSSRASWRGIGLEVEPVSLGDDLRPGEHDLLYIGGGQDREQALIAPDLAARCETIRKPSTAAWRRWRSAAATSFWAGSIADGTARSCPERVSFRTKRLPERAG